MDHTFTQAQALFEYTRTLRRDFHQHPELGLKEVRTASIIARELSNLSLEVHNGVGQTGVVSLIEGKAAGPVVLLRFDMDALPIQEQTGAEYASLTPGVMHACGHDGHVAIGLTVARLLNEHRHEFSGTVKLVFQPGEEGLGGAEKMIADGVLVDPKPDIALSLHVWNEKPVGWVGIVPGPVMAAADTFSVKITGKGGHGAGPHLTVDPIVAAAQVVSALQSIISRNVNPLKTAVVTVASIHAGEAFNVIPAEIEMKGTLRTFETEVRDMLIKRFQEVVNNVSLAMGCQADIEIQSITPAVVNDPEITNRVQQVAQGLLPKDLLDFQTTTMGAEDMAFILQEIPGCYFFIGSANPGRHLDAPHHNSRFDFDESILPKAAGLMVASALAFLGH
ncbi:MAG: amidohydrolase [Anaerolineales bacterium]|nr:MAG: amidohydrolase [Anaerolineales bacterium]